MAASTACSACIFRLANSARSISNNKLLHISRNQIKLSPLCVFTSCRNMSQNPPNYYHKYQELKEDQEDQDQRVQRTGVEESTAEWKWVERLIPPLTPPGLPKHESYPTPSGFSPPTGASSDCAYHIGRTVFHGIPVHRHDQFNGTRQLTVVSKIDGDIWALANELKDHLQTTRDDINIEIPMQVNEYTHKIWFKGVYVDELRGYIQKKGF